jgi:hypothetical protein
MAYFETYSVAGTLAGSLLNSRCGSLIFPLDVQQTYSGTAGSVYLLVRIN